MNNDLLLPRPSREEIAQRDIGHTDVSSRTAWLLIASFLLTLSAPPTIQLAYELLQIQTNPIPQAAGPQVILPSSLQLLDQLPEIATSFQLTQGQYPEKIRAANQQLMKYLEEYEQQLEERSLLTLKLLGPTRELMAKYGGIGSDRVDVGYDGWLFFRTDLEYLTGPGFLEPNVLNRQTTTGTHLPVSRQSDPRRAIFEFHEQLASRGIRLLVMPTPGKPSIYPERLTRDFNRNVDVSTLPLQNASFEQFKRELIAKGILFFDPAEVLAETKHTAGDIELFLRTDTHWTPTGMEYIARRLSEFIVQESLLPQQSSVTYERRSHDVTNLGDLALMLRLPAGQTLFLPETVTVRQVEERAGGLWQPDTTSDLLLIGDSFTNIFSIPELNWSIAAGLAEQLSFHLQRPVDRVAPNNGGSFAARQTLFQELAKGHDRLDNKRLVIWQFATRDLASGDWRLLAMPKIPPNANRSEPPIPAANELIVLGTVKAAAGAPRPGTVPYRDAVTCVHLVEVNGLGELSNKRELVVYLWGLKDNEPTSAARFTSGQHVKLKLIPWDEVKHRYERFNRIELDDPEFHLADLPVYWATP